MNEDREWRAPDAKRMTFDEMAARAQYEWDRAEKAEAEAKACADAIEAKDAEVERLRQAACDCAAAIGNGAFLSPDSSLEFIEKLPGEIAQYTKRLRDGANSFESKANLWAAQVVKEDECRQMWQSRAEQAEAEIERLKNALGDPDGTIAHADAIESRAEQAERALNREQDNTYASFDKWSKALGWGLTGNQPECWALMDSAVEELVNKRRTLAEAVEVLRPFASYLDQARFDLDNKGNPLPDEQGMGWVYLTVGDFRVARAFAAQRED